MKKEDYEELIIRSASTDVTQSFALRPSTMVSSVALKETADIRLCAMLLQLWRSQGIW